PQQRPAVERVRQFGILSRTPDTARLQTIQTSQRAAAHKTQRPFSRLPPGTEKAREETFLSRLGRVITAYLPKYWEISFMRPDCWTWKGQRPSQWPQPTQ